MRAALAVLLALLVLAPPAGAQPPAGWRDAGEIVASPDGAHVYAAGDTMLSFRVDQASGALSLLDANQPGGAHHPRLAMSPDGRYLYTAFGNDIEPTGIMVFSRDPATGLLTHEHTFRGGPEARVSLAPIVSMTVSPDGGQLYVVQRKDAALHVFHRDRETGMLSLQGSLYTGSGEALPDMTDLNDFEVSGDGRFGYLTSSMHVVEFARDPATGALTRIGNAPLSATGFSIALSADGRRAYAGTTNYHAYDRDVTTGHLSSLGYQRVAGDDHHGPAGPGTAITVAPDGNVFSSSPRDRALLQAAPTQEGVELRRTYPEGANGFSGVAHAEGFAWSPDGRFLFTSASEYIPPERYPSSRGELGIVSSFRYDNGGLTLSSTAGPGIEVPVHEGRRLGRRGGVSINDGELYTNDPNVVVTITPPGALLGSFRLSNTPGVFAGKAVRVDLTDRYHWRLAETGGSRDVRRVYVRFTPARFEFPRGDLSDDIILDQRRPQVLDAVMTPGTLKLRARDNRSGVRKMQVTRNRRKPGRERKYARRVRVARGARVVHVRVVDGAGNRSRWRKVKRR